MNSFKKLLLGAVCAAAWGSLAQPASAAMISYTSAMFDVTDMSSFTAQIPELSPALGTVTSVTIVLNATVTPSAVVYNFNGSPVAFLYAYATSTTTNPYTLMPIAGSPTPSPATWIDPYGNSGQTDAMALMDTVGEMAPIGETSYPGSAVPVGLTSAVPMADVGGFQGVGDYPFQYDTSGVTNYGGSASGLFFGGGTEYAGTATVTYNYTPLPEPTSLSLLGLGGLASLRRRRKA